MPKPGLRPSLPSFNAGVLALDLDAWRARNATAELEAWMRANALSNPPIYKLGSNPPMLLTFADSFEPLDRRWNVDGLGWRKGIATAGIAGGAIYHWSGPNKPWLVAQGTDEWYRRLWAPWFRSQCFD